MKQEQEIFFYQLIKALVLGLFVVLPRWRKQKEVLKKGFQKRCDTNRYKELAFAPVLESLVKNSV